MRPAPSRHGAGGGGVGGLRHQPHRSRDTFSPVLRLGRAGVGYPRLVNVVHCGAWGSMYREQGVTSSRKGPGWSLKKVRSPIGIMTWVPRVDVHDSNRR